MHSHDAAAAASCTQPHRTPWPGELAVEAGLKVAPIRRVADHAEAQLRAVALERVEAAWAGFSAAGILTSESLDGAVEVGGGADVLALAFFTWAQRRLSSAVCSA